MTPDAHKEVLKRLVAAGELATKGKWLPLHQVENGTLFSWEVRQEDFTPTDKHEFPQRICQSVRGIRFPKKSPDCDFIALAANARPSIAYLLERVEELVGALEKIANVKMPITANDSISYLTLVDVKSKAKQALTHKPKEE